jgi:hypothetical protein
MTTIQKALMTQFYPAIDIALMEEIVDATPNCEVATEILCGIYVEPDVPTIINDGTRECILISYDKWTKTVRYHYFTPKKIGVYFPKSVKEETITEENYKSLQASGNARDDAYHHWVVTSEMEKNTTGMDLDKWMKLHHNNPVDMLARALDKGIVTEEVA